MGYLNVIKRFRYLVFLLFTLDIFLRGSGVNYTIAEINTRKIFLVIFGVVSCCIYVLCQKHDLRQSLKNIQIFGIAIFIVLWVVIIPKLTHGNLSYSTSDALPVIAPAIFLLTTDFGKNGCGWVKIRYVIFYLLLAFSLLHVSLYDLSRNHIELFNIVREFLLGFWDSDIAEYANFVFLNPTDIGSIRIYFGSSFFLLIGLYFFAQKYESPIKNIKILKTAFLLLILIAFWATNTRSLILGAGIFILLLPVTKRIIPNLRINLFSMVVMLVLPFVLSFILLPSIDPHFLGTLGTVREGSDDLRAEQFSPLFYDFLNHPFLGQGFGASVSLIRSEDAPYAYELSILALFMKIGLIGFFWACTVFASAIYSAIPMAARNFSASVAPLYCLYFSYIISCVFNPYMFGLFGTFFSLFLLYEFVFLTENSEND